MSDKLLVQPLLLWHTAGNNLLKHQPNWFGKANQNYFQGNLIWIALATSPIGDGCNRNHNSWRTSLAATPLRLRPQQQVLAAMFRQLWIKASLKTANAQARIRQSGSKGIREKLTRYCTTTQLSCDCGTVSKFKHTTKMSSSWPGDNRHSAPWISPWAVVDGIRPQTPLQSRISISFHFSMQFCKKLVDLIHIKCLK